MLVASKGAAALLSNLLFALLGCRIACIHCSRVCQCIPLALCAQANEVSSDGCCRSAGKHRVQKSRGQNHGTLNCNCQMLKLQHCSTKPDQHALVTFFTALNPPCVHEKCSLQPAGPERKEVSHGLSVNSGPMSLHAVEQAESVTQLHTTAIAHY